MQSPLPRRLLPALAGLVLLLPASVQAQDAAADPLPEPGTILAPGRYVSRAVGPTIDFRVEEGWRVGPAPPGPIFTLERADQPGTVLSITRFDGDAFLDSCDPSSLIVVEGTVGRLMEIIGGNPYLNPGPPGSSTSTASSAFHSTSRCRPTPSAPGPTSCCGPSPSLMAGSSSRLPTSNRASSRSMSTATSS